MRVFLIFIPFLLLFLSSFTLFSQDYINYLTGDSTDVTVTVQAGFVLAGGGQDNNDAMKWMLQRAKGGDVVVLRASGSNGYNNYFYSDLGVAVNSVETIVFLNKKAASSPYVIEKIRNAEVIFIAGGDQTKYFDYWHDTETGLLLRKICADRIVVVGGTSAGMMILGDIVYAPEGLSVISDEALRNPFHKNLNQVHYKKFIITPVFENVVFDTHFDDRNRSGRLFTFMARAAYDAGIRGRAIACNESTAVCIDHKNIATIFGESPQYPDYAYFLEVNCEENWLPEKMVEGSPLHWKLLNTNAVISQRISGTNKGAPMFDLNEWKSLVPAKKEFWYAEEGTLQKKPVEDVACKWLSSTNQSADTYPAYIFPNPVTDRIMFPLAQKAAVYLTDGRFLYSCVGCDSIQVDRLKVSGLVIVRLQYQNTESVYRCIID